MVRVRRMNRPWHLRCSKQHGSGRREKWLKPFANQPDAGTCRSSEVLVPEQRMMQRVVPVLPESAPFTAEQRAWLNGFLAGMFAEATERPNSPMAPAEGLLILYGSQTGTAQQLARQVATESARHGFAAKVLEMNACTRDELARQKRVLVVTSTWGDGDPPDNAAQFWSLLNSAEAPSLEG